MSAGNFVKSKYEADYGLGDNVHPIKVQPETLLAVIGAVPNTAPVSTVNSPISAEVSSSTRSLGLHARLVSLTLGEDSLLPGYAADSTVRIPAVNKNFFAAAQTATEETVVTYLGVAWVVSGTRAEKVR